MANPEGRELINQGVQHEGTLCGERVTNEQRYRYGEALGQRLLRITNITQLGVRRRRGDGVLSTSQSLTISPLGGVGACGKSVEKSQGGRAACFAGCEAKVECMRCHVGRRRQETVRQVARLHVLASRAQGPAALRGITKSDKKRRSLRPMQKHRKIYAFKMGDGSASYQMRVKN